MSSIIEIIKGDSSDIYGVRVKDENGTYYNISDANWTGTIVVRATLGGADLINNALTKSSDNTKFFGQLTPTDTNGLTADVIYYMTIEVKNSTITFPFNKEEQRRIKILAEGA